MTPAGVARLTLLVAVVLALVVFGGSWIWSVIT